MVVEGGGGGSWLVGVYKSWTNERRVVVLIFILFTLVCPPHLVATSRLSPWEYLRIRASIHTMLRWCLFY